jgi:FkbM family methyltransferase
MKNNLIKNKEYHSVPLDLYTIPETCNGIAVDIGSALGMFSKNYYNHFEFIYAFEPVYSNFIESIENTKNLENIMIFPFAFSKTTADLISMKSSGMTKYNYVSNVSDEISSFSHNKNMTKDIQFTFSINLKSILEICGGNIDYLKIDCEGAELSLIDDELVQKINYIGMEVHEFIYGKEKLNELYDFLSKYFVIEKNNKNLWFCQNKLLSL